ncbi:LPS-assembly protein LptD [Agitococcus lubricus]|uniref:LPS-assembly protein LptD n=1 Tax=Agitococcus lubricus TaxID=1077255 RepID=A0A2T5J172_9GAMM|nr:LPS assembly protein LptD [Agitococcus lubricus]PTQ90132.1 LPS-assembly protein [Agitococcus lubricus]
MPELRLFPFFFLISSIACAGETVNYQRLGWLTQAEIGKLPLEQQPVYPKVCQGAWITPIASTVKAPTPDSTPVEALAAWVYYNPEGESKLNGNVRISQQGRLIEADNAELSQGQNTGKFKGNILLAEPGVVMTGEQADIDLQSDIARLERAEFVATFLNAHGRADQIQRDSQGIVTIAAGEYSTCEPNDRVWYFSAHDLSLNPTTGRGTVKRATLHVQDIPVIYVPYFNFPIDGRRMSGLLVPRFGTTNDGGFDFAQPIYWNIAPNYDATFTPRILSRRGLMAESEFRYLTATWGEGEVNGAFLPSDKLYEDLDRKRATWRHRYRPANWQLSSNVNYVSDGAYFTDLGTDLVQSNTTHQERSADFSYWGKYWTGLVRVQGYQTIDPLLQDIDKPYARLPQLLVTAQLPNSSPIQTHLLSELTHFQRSITDNSGAEVNGLRWRIEPELSYDLHKPWGFVTPKLGFKQLAYRLDGDMHNTSHINATHFSIDTGLVFERPAKSFTQTLEPRLFYVFSPYHEQNDLPNFDTASTTFSFAQLFRASRFSGGDRVDDANQISLGLTSRRIDNEDGSERLRISLGEVFYFRDRKVQLNSSDPIATASTSGLAGEINAQFNASWSGSADALWTADGNTSQFGLQLHYLPNTYERLFNLGYSFRREVQALNQKALRQTSLSFIQPLSLHWQMLGLWQYDLLNKETPDSLLGVTYDACCWQVSFYRRQFLADVDNTSAAERKRSAFFIELKLKGLAGLSSGVNDLLANRVFGYQLIKPDTKNNSRF